MSTMTFDTHAFIKRLMGAGMPEAQAETVADALRETRDTDMSQIATKADLREDVLRLEVKLSETRADILKWVLGALAAQTAFLSAIKFFGH